MAMVDRDDLEATLRYLLDDHYERLLKRLLEVASEFTARGTFISSMHVVQIGESVVEAAKGYAVSASEALALACGSAAPEYLDIYEQVGAEALRQFTSVNAERASKLGLSNRGRQGQADVEVRVNKVIDQHARELRLGIARGKVLMAIGDTINVNDSQGVAINSREANIKASRDHLQVSVGWRSDEFVEALQKLRELIHADTSIPGDTRDELEDAAHVLQREALDKNLDPGRLQRLAKGFARRAEQVALGAAGSALTPYITKLLEALP
jgi:hypothetical protein